MLRSNDLLLSVYTTSSPRSNDQAQNVIAVANQLQKSTRAEVEAAYQVRQKRRQAATAYREDQYSEPT